MSTTMLRFSKLNKKYAYLILFLFNIFNLVWIILDKRVWAWDQSHYGRGTLQLYYTLINSPKDWFAQMLSTFQLQAPGIALLGEFFVPLGDFFGSIEIGLLLSIFLIQFLVLILIFESINKLSNGKVLISLVASLIVASAPLFVGLSHYYLVEPIQTLAVSWFIFIMSFSPQWKKKYIAIQLIVATPFAMLAKISSPIYCFIPVIVALIHNYLPSLFQKSKTTNTTTNKTDNSIYAWLSLGLLLIISSSAWYIKNWIYITQHVKVSASSELWGKKETFLNKIDFWLHAFQVSFFLKGIYIFVLLIVLAGFIVFFLKKKQKFVYFDLCAFSSLINIITVLTLFSLSVNEDVRFLLPLIPHVSLFIAWSLFQLQGQLITAFLALLLTVQLVLVHCQSLGIIHYLNLPYVWTLDTNLQKTRSIEKLVQKTCLPDKNTTSIVGFVGVDIDWLNANTLNYFAIKQLKTRELLCTYASLDHGENDPKKVWQKLLSLKVNYFISVESFLIPDNPFNQVSLPLLELVKNHVNFQLDSSISDSGILLYKIGDFQEINYPQKNQERVSR